MKTSFKVEILLISNYMLSELPERYFIVIYIQANLLWPFFSLTFALLLVVLLIRNIACGFV